MVKVISAARLALIALALSCGAVAGQNATGSETGQPNAGQQNVVVSPVLTINQDRLYIESRYGQAFVTQHAVREQALAAENEEIRLALEEEELLLSELRDTMPAADFRDLANAFDDKVQSIYRTQNAKGDALNRMIEENRQTFFQVVPPILEAIAREAGAAVILDERVVLISARSLDITDRAIARIDAELAAGDTAPAPQE